MHPSPHRFNASRRHALVVILAVIAFILALARATNRENTADEVLFSACLALALATALVFFTRRIGLGLLLAAGLMLALRTISLVKQSYLGTLLYASDLLYFGNGNTLDVIAHYPQIWRLRCVARWRSAHSLSASPGSGRCGGGSERGGVCCCSWREASPA